MLSTRFKVMQTFRNTWDIYFQETDGQWSCLVGGFATEEFANDYLLVQLPVFMALYCMEMMKE